LCCPVWANTLTLEFAQEGEPSQPRALIIIHNINESREDLKNLFAAWATGSWGRDQYCSLYCYEYDGNGLQSLVSSEKLSQDLYARIRSDNFDKGTPDAINPARRSAPTDGRQPAPRLRGENLQLLLAGSGYGGLVARRVALLVKADERKVQRVAYIGTPLDGLSTIDLLLGLQTVERAPLLGLDRAVEPEAVGNISPAWWSLTELFDEARDWPEVFAPAHQGVQLVAAYASTLVPPHPSDNVLYGRYRSKSYSSPESHDGFLPQPLSWGRKTGPIAWLSETALPKTSHAALTEASADFVLKQALDRPVIFGYLAQRQVIEELVRGKVGEPPLYQYWDERDEQGMTPQWRGAYASRKALYEMMWGVAP
jgi:hypothetical protein